MANAIASLFVTKNVNANFGKYNYKKNKLCYHKLEQLYMKAKKPLCLGGKTYDKNKKNCCVYDCNINANE